MITYIAFEIHLEFLVHYITLTNYYILRTYWDYMYSQNNKYRKKNNRVNKMTTLDWNTLRIFTNYITLTDYYIVKNTFRSQVIIAS